VKGSEVGVGAVLDHEGVVVTGAKERQRHIQIALGLIGGSSDQPVAIGSLAGHDDVFTDLATKRPAFAPWHFLGSDELE